MGKGKLSGERLSSFQTTLAWAPLVFLLFTSITGILFGFFLLTPLQMKECFQGSGFYFIFAAFVVWLLGFPFQMPSLEEVGSFFRQHGIPLLVALAIAVASFFTSPREFRILADETNLLGMASAMYDHHSFYNPTQKLHYFHGASLLVVKEWDKRTLFFPFLVYLTHCATGYRCENAFLVNGVFGFLALFLFYLLLQRWFSRFIAVLGMLFLGVYPVVIMWITSAGFEIPNLAFAILVFLLLDEFTQHPDAPRAEWLVLTLLLLAQIRYESAIFILVFAPIIIYLLPKREWFRISWRLGLVPLLFLPVAWQRLTSTGMVLFQMKNGQSPFHINWLWGNLKHAFRFFHGSSVHYGTVPLLWWLAIAGLGLVLYRILRGYVSGTWKFKGLQESDGSSRRPLRKLVLCFAGALVVFLQGAILFNYYWGNLTLQIAHRLGIVFLPFILILGLQVIEAISQNGQRFRKGLLVLVFALFVFHWNIPGQNAAVREIFMYREFRLVSDWLKNNCPMKDDILLTDLPNLYTPFRYSAISLSTFNASPDIWMNRVRTHLFQRLLAIQKIKYVDGKPTLMTFLSPEVAPKILYETQLHEGVFLRISEIVSLPKKGPVSLPDKLPGAPIVEKVSPNLE